ncbi:MAG: methionyl-tRNA formyltransferase [Candidatus Dojkabacteria bacterium]|jgi:methionyl-tRNA formyltransferase|nr:methionyl-tRNA formyltransferase [Candidatus Dojkabacteria bacterium]
MIKLCFFGSGDFSLPIMKKLIKSKKIRVVGLITSPNRSKQENNLGKYAAGLEIEVFPFENVNKDGPPTLKRLMPDINLVCNYGQFLSKEIFDFPQHRTLNIHASLLPKLRGACPIESAILRGLKKTGLTIQILEQEMDVGDIIFRKEVEIDRLETGGSLRKKLQNIAAGHIEKVISDWTRNKIIPLEQEHANATYCYRGDVSKETARIDWQESAVSIERKVRAFNPQPAAWTIAKIGNIEKRIKIFDVKISQKLKSGQRPGAAQVTSKSFSVQSGTYPILVLSVQMEGKKRISAEEFVRGLKDKIQFL